jgi:hypothetical protein
VGRNAVLASLALAAAQPAIERPVGAGDFAVAAAAVLLSALVYAAFNQLLRQQPARRTSSRSSA